MSRLLHTVAVVALIACSSPPVPNPQDPDPRGFARPEVAETAERRGERRRGPVPVSNTAATPTPPAPTPPVPATECTERTQLGALTICGGVHEAPSHGGEDAILVAFYSFENRGTDPVTLDLVALDIVDPQGARVPFSGLAWSIDNYTGSTTTTIPPSATVKAVIDGKAKLDTLRYHVAYHHEATFKVGTDQAVVRSGLLEFRYPYR